MDHSPGAPQPPKWNQKSHPGPQNRPGWFERHRILSIALQIIAVPLLGAAVFFLWIFDAKKYAITTGVILVCLVVAMIKAPDHNALSPASSAEPPPSPHPQTPPPKT